MALTNASIPTKNRILTACVQLFLKKGYNGTTVIEILREAEVSASSFQNIFRNKEGVLLELVESMFANQFGTARRIVGEDASPILVYTAETAIQMALTELNENLRDIYLEAYTQPQCTEYIFQHTAAELKGIFGPYLPEAQESDFYELEIGSAGIMRAYMAKRCDVYFPLERKLERFLRMSLAAYRVPEAELEGAVRFVEGLNIRAIAEQVMHRLFQALAMRFEFSLDGVPETGTP